MRMQSEPRRHGDTEARSSDDSAVYVESVKFLGPDVCGVDGLRIQIVELPA